MKGQEKNLEEILTRAVAGERLSFAEGVALFSSSNLLALGQAADLVRRRLHPDNVVTFVIDRNINYTNVCEVRCRFCAFHRAEDSPEAYVLSREEIFRKIEETVAAGGTQILLQGGLHPGLTLDYFLDLLQEIKARFKVHLHAFSPPEIVYLARKADLPVEEVLSRLQEAGLDSLPGGGAEILDDRVRRCISPRKIGWREWMEVMLAAHRLGMKTTATMMFGSVETPEERVQHLIRVREAQDRYGGFTAFIPWSFQPQNTELADALSGLPEGWMPATGVDYLKTLAISRLMLDNIPNLQVSWVTQGDKMAQVALRFGANDFGGTMMEENVVRAAGAAYRVPLEEIVRCIKDAGFIPVQRDTLYRHLFRLE